MKVVAVLILMILGVVNVGFSQTQVADTVVYDAVEEDAEFIGGHKAMVEWISENLVTPDKMKKSDYGKIYVQFIVERDGTIKMVTLQKGISRKIDNAVIEMMKKMPNWKPGINNGKPVRSKFTLPIAISQN